MGEESYRGTTNFMKRVHILVEGQTEETFVRELLQKHFWSININLTPIIISNKKVKSGQKFKGGVTSYERTKNELKKLFEDTSVVAITTMIDYYGLPNDFPGYQTIPRNSSCYEKVSYLTEEFQKDISNSRFYPFLTLHEFEALLFVDPGKIARRFPSHSNIDAQLSKICSSFSSPEEINNGNETHPSARIQALIDNYEKVSDGIIIAQRIGLEKIRSECSHFNQWLGKLESL